MKICFQILVYFCIIGFLSATVHQCPSEGKWVLKSFDNSFFCYLKMELGSNVDARLLKNDICKQKAHPLSQVASIHSKAENDFLMSNFYGAMIGYFIPKSVKWNPNNFRWSDGSKVDFIRWDTSGIPKQPDNQFPKERFVKLRQKFKSKGWHDYRLKEMNSILCKMNALESSATPSPATKTSASPTKITETFSTTLIPTQTSATSTTLKTTNKETEATTTALNELSTTTSSPTTAESKTTQSSTPPPTTVSSSSTSTSAATTTTTSSMPNDGDIVILDGAQP